MLSVHRHRLRPALAQLSPLRRFAPSLRRTNIVRTLLAGACHRLSEHKLPSPNTNAGELNAVAQCAVHRMPFQAGEGQSLQGVAGTQENGSKRNCGAFQSALARTLGFLFFYTSKKLYRLF